MTITEPSSESPPARQESLIEYPSLFPIKVMGLKVDGLVHTVSAIARAITGTRWNGWVFFGLKNHRRAA